MNVHIERGLDLRLSGDPAQSIEGAAPVGSVALLGEDYAFVKPVLAVAEGDVVRLGQTLFTHRAEPAIRFTAPASGRVAAINRGRKRRLRSVVIEVDERDEDTQVRAPLTQPKIASLARDEVVAALLETGLWTALRARPFEAVASPTILPRAVFVTALDSRPLAADPAVVIAAAGESWRHGLTALSRLGPRVLVCARGELPVPDCEGIAVVEVSGPHPAGLPGTHIERLATVAERPDLWHLGYQDVIAIGRLFGEGRLSTERIVALGGPGMRRPRLVATRAGAFLGDLLRDELAPGSRVVAGSVLDGRLGDAATDFLGRYETQIAAMPDADEARARPPRAAADGMLNVEAFERVWPFALPPMPLLRALLTRDVGAARRLGGLGLAAEDLALCAYVCPAKHDYGAALNATLEALRAEL